LFEIFETEQFLIDLNNDFSGQQKRIKAKLSAYVYPQLRQQPFFGKNIKKLKDFAPDTWRYKIGNYRLFYTIDELKKTVFMLTIEHRKDAY
jgi:mRNA interferase RelE/StbE